MTALLLLAHGSPRASANAALEFLAERLWETGPYPVVVVGYLECNSPSIPEAIDRCVELGATEIRAVPWFLHIGTHVAQDLPEFLDAGRERHPTVTFLLADYVGLAGRVGDLLADRARA
ncbi:MAG: sirohydrochlorin chelatase, partial [Armatimonadota bacterium]